MKQDWKHSFKCLIHIWCDQQHRRRRLNSSRKVVDYCLIKLIEIHFIVLNEFNSLHNVNKFERLQQFVWHLNCVTGSIVWKPSTVSTRTRHQHFERQQQFNNINCFNDSKTTTVWTASTASMTTTVWTTATVWTATTVWTTATVWTATIVWQHQLFERVQQFEQHEQFKANSTGLYFLCKRLTSRRPVV